MRGSNHGADGILPTKGRILQSLNLKNPRAYHLASELADLTGESLTSAVISALEQRLERERRRQRKSSRADDILAFARKFASGMAAGSSSADHATELFSEDGLPQ